MGYIGNLSIKEVLKSVLILPSRLLLITLSVTRTTRSWMTSTTTKTYLSLSSKTLVTASFDATLTNDTLMHGVKTIPELQSVP